MCIYVLFNLNDETFAISVESVRKIEESGKWRKLPNTSERIYGFMELESGILPILDLDLILYDLKNEERNDKKVMVLFKHGKLMGILVDKVIDIRGLDEDYRYELNNSILRDTYVKGISKGDNIIILDEDLIIDFMEEEIEGRKYLEAN